MKLVVGLGNPGPRYAPTRHNIGFRIVERLAVRAGLALADEPRLSGRFGRGAVDGRELALLEPLTFMNRAGDAVAAAVDVFSIAFEDLLVVYDDVDLPLGQLRLRAAGGSGGHRGLADVIEQLASREFPRLRFGVGRPPPGVSTTEYVLEPFTSAEEEQLAARIEAAAEAAESVVRHGVVFSMNRYNAPPAAPETEADG